MAIVFTGTTEEIRLKNLIHSALVLNELGDESPYALSHADTSRSGYSFGYVQWDIASNDDGARILREVLETASSLESAVINAIIDFLDDSVGDPDAIQNNPDFGQEVLDSINNALSSQEGQNIIDDEHVIAIDGIFTRVSGVISAVEDDEDNAFLNTDIAFTFLADYHNQFDISPNGSMERFLQDGTATIGGRTVQRVGDLRLDDLLNFYFSTQYASTNLGLDDELRRFNNVISLAGGVYALSGDQSIQEDEAEGLIRIYQDFLMGKESQLENFDDFETQVLQPAREYLIDEYVNSKALGIVIDGQVVVGEDDLSHQRNQHHDSENDTSLQGSTQNDLILGEVGNDTLSGGGASDILYGGEDDDTLYGGNYANTEDNATDYLFGGEGFDVYHVGNGDIISDTDGKGRVVYDGNVLLPGFHSDGDDENTYRSLDGAFTYTLVDNQLFVRPTQNGPAVAIINNFSNGNLGIALRDMPDTRIRTSIEVYEYWSIEESRIQNSGARMAA